jgi:DNA-binding PadR family transcriptional regulator
MRQRDDNEDDDLRGRRGRHGRHGHGRRGGFGGRHGGSGRLFDHGELRHVVLALLGEQPRHGYEIIRVVEERTGGAYVPSPGVIYPTLQLLKDVGHAVPTAEDQGRNRYEITPEGRAFLESNATAVGDLMSRMTQVSRRHATASPAIVAAMDNLKSALRSAAGPWSDADVREIAAAIDDAAARIRIVRSRQG